MLLENWHHICSMQACHEPSISKKQHLQSTEQMVSTSMANPQCGQQLLGRDICSLTQVPLRSIHSHCRTAPHRLAPQTLWAFPTVVRGLGPCPSSSDPTLSVQLGLEKHY